MRQLVSFPSKITSLYNVEELHLSVLKKKKKASNTASFPGPSSPILALFHLALHFLDLLFSLEDQTGRKRKIEQLSYCWDLSSGASCLPDIKAKYHIKTPTLNPLEHK